MRRILVLEDEPDLLEMLAAVLAASGFDVTKAASRSEGVRLLERRAFDLVLADLMLAGRDADVAWRGIAEVAHLARPGRVGVITGWPVKQRPAEIAFVLRKPCMRKDLLAAVNDALQVPPLDHRTRATLRAYFGTLENHAYDELAALCTEDVVYELPGADPRFSNVISGRAAFLAFTDETFRNFRDPHFALGAMTSMPNGALVEYIGSWREGDASRSMPGAVMFEFRDDRIARIGVRVDPDRLA